jgi:peptide/nickel transport system ATP-binding protein/oligopeptide transport system ATP-binding protein
LKTPLVRVSTIRKTFDTGTVFRRHAMTAVNDVSFDILSGETLGLVGESGSGKSTLGRIVVGLTPPSSGHVTIGEHRLGALAAAERKAVWRQAQMVFQDPHASLDPRMTVHDLLAEPLRNFGIARGAEAAALIAETLDACGLGTRAAPRYPSEFSGGQRQRIGIARALIVRPRFIVADEPVSALDVSVQAQIINLLQDLRAAFGLTFLFISHDLAVVRHIADRVAVMFRGRLVEIGEAAAVYASPLHPYTQLLLRSVPLLDPSAEAERLARRVAEPKDAAPASGGCAFRMRCPHAEPLCAAEEPSLSSRSGGHLVACHFADGQRRHSVQGEAA